MTPVMNDDIMPRSLAISLLCSSIFGALFWAGLILLAFPHGVRLPAGLTLANLYAQIDEPSFREDADRPVAENVRADDRDGPQPT